MAHISEALIKMELFSRFADSWEWGAEVVEQIQRRMLAVTARLGRWTDVLRPGSLRQGSVSCKQLEE